MKTHFEACVLCGKVDSILDVDDSGRKWIHPPEHLCSKGNEYVMSLMDQWLLKFGKTTWPRTQSWRGWVSEMESELKERLSSG